MSNLIIVPVKQAEAKSFIEKLHRHHKPPLSSVFQIGVSAGDVLVGVIMVGRPVARHYDDGWTLEVNRSATDGTKNANSILYGAAWRAAKALGWRRLITYTLQVESGVSLKAAGWKVVAERKARAWDTPSRPRQETDASDQPKLLWEAA